MFCINNVMGRAFHIHCIATRSSINTMWRIRGTSGADKIFVIKPQGCIAFKYFGCKKVSPRFNDHR